MRIPLREENARENKGAFLLFVDEMKLNILGSFSRDFECIHSSKNFYLSYNNKHVKPKCGFVVHPLRRRYGLDPIRKWYMNNKQLIHGKSQRNDSINDFTCLPRLGYELALQRMAQVKLDRT